MLRCMLLHIIKCDVSRVANVPMIFIDFYCTSIFVRGRFPFAFAMLLPQKNIVLLSQGCLLNSVLVEIDATYGIFLYFVLTSFFGCLRLLVYYCLEPVSQQLSDLCRRFIV